MYASMNQVAISQGKWFRPVIFIGSIKTLLNKILHKANKTITWNDIWNAVCQTATILSPVSYTQNK